MILSGAKLFCIDYPTLRYFHTTMHASTPFIHCAPHTDGGTQACFAILLESLGADRRSLNEKDDFALRWLMRHMNVINSLYCPSPERTLALRYVARPEPTRFSAGRVEIALLGAISGATEAEARERAENLLRETLGHLVAAFSECTWKIVTTEQDFMAVWRPFDFEKAHFAEILRREDLTPLETLRLRPSLRKGKQVEARSKPAMDKSVYFVHPFLIQDTTMSRLLRILLFQPAPVLLQIALSPVTLTETEESALQLEITKCETSSHHEDNEINTSPLHSGLLETRAKALANGLMQKLAGLEDAPFLMQITVASPAPLGETLVETIGTEITRPPARTIASDESAWNFFGGGYDIALPCTEADRGHLRTCFERLSIHPWGSSLAPESLRRIRHLMSGDEAACAFRLPVCGPDGIEGISVRPSRQRPLPRESAAVGLDGGKALLLGENRCFGPPQPVHLTERDRKQHLYVVGQTGTGKTTLLKTMILSDIRNGEGIAVLDPHGDLYNELLESIPPERRDDVIAIDPTDTECPVGVNLLECNSPEERFLIAYQMRDIIERMIHDQYGTNNGGMIGPMFFYHVQMNLLLAMSRPDLPPSTLEDFVNIFMVKKYHERWLPIPPEDKIVSDWANNTLKNYDYLKRGSDSSLSMGEWVASKFLDFIYDPKLRGIFTQQKSTIDFRKAMDEGKILLINLAKGEMAEHLSRFLGMVILAKLQCAAMSRVDLPQKQRLMFHLYVDEFQAIATGSFITMLSEARKFGLSLVLANQFFSQFKDERIMQSVVGNVGTTICFRVGREDAEALEPQFTPHFDRFDLANLPNWNACVKTTVQGQVVSPFSLATVPVVPPPDAVPAAEVIAASRKRYGKINVAKDFSQVSSNALILTDLLLLAKELKAGAHITDDTIEGLFAYTCAYKNLKGEHFMPVRARITGDYRNTLSLHARMMLPDPLSENAQETLFEILRQNSDFPEWEHEPAENCIRIREVIHPQKEASDGKVTTAQLLKVLSHFSGFADLLTMFFEKYLPSETVSGAPTSTSDPDILQSPFRLDRLRAFLLPIAPDASFAQPAHTTGRKEPMLICKGVFVKTNSYRKWAVNGLELDFRVSPDGSRAYAATGVMLDLPEFTPTRDVDTRLRDAMDSTLEKALKSESSNHGLRLIFAQPHFKKELKSPERVFVEIDILLQEGGITIENIRKVMDSMGRMADFIEEDFSIPQRKLLLPDSPNKAEQVALQLSQDKHHTQRP